MDDNTLSNISASDVPNLTDGQLRSVQKYAQSVQNYQFQSNVANYASLIANALPISPSGPSHVPPNTSFAKMAARFGGAFALAQSATTFFSESLPSLSSTTVQAAQTLLPLVSEELAYRDNPDNPDVTPDGADPMNFNGDPEDDSSFPEWPGDDDPDDDGRDDGGDGSGSGGGGRGDLGSDGPFENPPVSPLVLDLDGDGIELTPLAGSTTYFDLNIDGFAERTGWVDVDDALLALDVNGNGRIDDNSELFGNMTGHADGFSQLAELDSNSDGKIDADDLLFDQVVLWRDLDQDGISDSGELFSLSDYGIASIDLSAQVVDETNTEHLVSHRSSFEYADGTTGVIEDIHFQNDTASSVALLSDDFEYHEDALALPVLWGYGQIASTWVALSDDSVLRAEATTLVNQLASGDVLLFEQSFEVFILNWAGVSHIAPDSRGDHIDARHLGFLEKAYGVPFEQSGSPDPQIAAGIELETVYDELIQKLAGRFMAQAAVSHATLNAVDADDFGAKFAAQPLLGLTSLLVDYSSENRGLSGDLSIVVSSLSESVSSGSITSDNAARAVHLLSADLSSSDEEFYSLVSDAFDASNITVESDFFLSFQQQAGYEVLEGTDTSDTLTASSAAFVLAGLGNDVLNGTNSASTFLGGAGDDTVNGGDGADVFIYRLGDGSDVINDLSNTSARDVLLLEGLLVQDVTFQQTLNEDLLISFADGGAITVKGHFDGTAKDIEIVEFADGAQLDEQGIRDKSVADMKSSGVVLGSQHNENYFHALGDGSYSIEEFSNLSGELDRLTFSGLSSSDVSFSRTASDDLVIDVQGQDTITVVEHFDASKSDIDEIEFSDGLVLDAQGIRNKSASDMKASGVVLGSDHREEYTHVSSAGSYSIEDLSIHSSVLDRLTFTQHLATDLVFSLGLGDDLVIETSTGEFITIIDHFRNHWYDLEEMEFSDGSVVNIQGLSLNDLATISGQPTNTDPDAVDDVATVEQDGSVLIDALQNDSDADTDTLTIAAVLDPVNGTAVIENGQIRYTPDAGFSGTDQIFYTIEDGNAGSSTATVTVTVDPASSNPGSGVDEVFVGTSGNDDFFYYYNQGNDQIEENSSTSGEIDRLYFEAGITVSDLYSVGSDVGGRSDKDLTIGLHNGSGTMTILDDGRTSSLAERHHINEFVFDDGTVLTRREFIRETMGTDGNDIIYGSGENDDFMFRAGEGDDQISEGAANSGEVDRLFFEAGITMADLYTVGSDVGGRSDKDLTIGLHNGSGTMTILDDGRTSSLAERHHINEFVFDDGTVLSRQDFIRETMGTDGNDVFYGSGENDDFMFRAGEGDDRIAEEASNSGEIDRLFFEAGITVADLYTVNSDVGGRSDKDLTIGLHNGSGTMTILDDARTSSLAERHHINQFVFDDGTVLSRNEFMRATMGTDSNDTFYGSGENDEFIFRTNEGDDRIAMDSSNSGEVDRLYFEAGVTVADIVSSQSDVNNDGVDDLLITHQSQSGSITILSSYATNNADDHQIDEFIFDDGTVMNLTNFLAATDDPLA